MVLQQPEQDDLVVLITFQRTGLYVMDNNQFLLLLTESAEIRLSQCAPKLSYLSAKLRWRLEPTFASGGYFYICVKAERLTSGKKNPKTTQEFFALSMLYLKDQICILLVKQPDLCCRNTPPYIINSVLELQAGKCNKVRNGFHSNALFSVIHYLHILG